MKDEIRKAVELPRALEDQIFKQKKVAYELFEKGDYQSAAEKINAVWELIPEPKYNTSCSGMVLRAMQEILIKTKDFNRVETLFLEWANDKETCGYKVFDTTPFILLAEIYLFKNEIDKAKEQFAKAKKYKASKRHFAEKPDFYFEVMKGKIKDNDQIRQLFEEAMKNDALQADFEDISEESSEQIEILSEEGNDLFDNEKYPEAIAVWQKALALVPEPQQFYGESSWLETSIGDAYFQLGDFATALPHFENAKGNVMENGYHNPFICLRLGQCYLEQNDTANAKEFLLRAYMLEGEEIFEEENPKYFSFLEKNVELW